MQSTANREPSYTWPNLHINPELIKQIVAGDQIRPVSFLTNGNRVQTLPILKSNPIAARFVQGSNCQLQDLVVGVLAVAIIFLSGSLSWKMEHLKEVGIHV